MACLFRTCEEDVLIHVTDYYHYSFTLLLGEYSLHTAEASTSLTSFHIRTSFFATLPALESNRTKRKYKGFFYICRDSTKAQKGLQLKSYEAGVSLMFY